MAHYADIDLNEHLAEVTECPICSDKISNNRLLPCGHTFCLHCLEQYKRTTKAKGKLLSCPVCRRDFSIPKGGCSALPKNIIAEKLLEIKSDKDVVLSETKQCDTCDAENAVNATVYCIHCEQNLCDSCLKMHSKIKSTANHHIVPVSKSTQFKEFTRQRYCEDHPGYVLELLCNTCDTAICWKCRSITHTAHDISEIQEMADAHCEQLQSDTEDIRDRLATLSKIQENIKYQEKQLRSYYAKETDTVSKISGELIRSIVNNEENLKKKITFDMERKLQALQPHKSAVERQINTLKEHKTYIEELKDSGNVWEICQRSLEAHTKSEELLNANIINVKEMEFSKMSEPDIHKNLIKSNFSPRDEMSSDASTNDYVNVTSAKFPPEVPLRQRFRATTSESEMNFQMNSETKSPTDPAAIKRLSSVSPSSVISIGGGFAVLGVAAFKQQLYVAVESGSEIFVYDANSQKLLQKLIVPGLKQAGDLVFCRKSKCLYLTDWTNSLIYRVETEGAKNVTPWGTKGDFGSIWITVDANILLAGHESNSLKEYAGNGELLKTVNIISDKGKDVRPWHAVKLATGMYIFSYGSSSEQDYHRVCLLDPLGKIVKSFGDLRGRGTNALWGPYHLALDEKQNIIIVADCNNSRLVMLNTNLEYVGEITADLRKPRRLCMDAGYNRLYVTDNKFVAKKASDGRVVIFSLPL